MTKAQYRLLHIEEKLEGWIEIQKLAESHYSFGDSDSEGNNALIEIVRTSAHFIHNLNSILWNTPKTFKKTIKNKKK
jgi:hypothetical protein